MSSLAYASTWSGRFASNSARSCVLIASRSINAGVCGMSACRSTARKDLTCVSTRVGLFMELLIESPFVNRRHNYRIPDTSLNYIGNIYVTFLVTPKEVVIKELSLYKTRKGYLYAF